MRAIVYHNYGSPDNLNLEEVQKPAPSNNEVLIKVHAASLNYFDWQILTGESLFLRLTSGGLRRPKRQILGDDLAGRVEAVGENVKQFEPGDEVFGLCNSGGFAEYRCVPADKGFLAAKPAFISFEEAAALPFAGMTAWQSIHDKGQLQAGQKVLIVGASGGVGSYAVQIAKSLGAEVTGVCSAGKQEMVRSIGADHVIDYTQEDFSKSGQHYDLILAIAGYYPILAYRRALSPEGKYVCVGGSAAQYFQAVLLGSLISLTGSKKMGAMFTNPNHKDLASLLAHFESGSVVPVIDRCYPLNETAEALRYYGSGKVQGKVVISMAENNLS